MIDPTSLTVSEIAALALFLLVVIVCFGAAILVIVDMIFPLHRSASSKGDEIIH